MPDSRDIDGIARERVASFNRGETLPHVVDQVIADMATLGTNSRDYMSTLNQSYISHGWLTQIELIDEAVGFQQNNSFPPSDRALAVSRFAVEQEGSQLWSNHSELGDGRNGCAASVSNLLRRAGLLDRDILTVTDLKEQLLKDGYRKHPMWEAKDGDVVFMPGPGGGADGHVGIVHYNEQGQLMIYNNSQDKAGNWKWQGQPMSSWPPSQYDEFYVLQLHQSNHYNRVRDMR